MRFLDKYLVPYEKVVRIPVVILTHLSSCEALINGELGLVVNGEQIMEIKVKGVISFGY